jgi:hypothetical protein
MDEHDRRGLITLALGIGLALWAMHSGNVGLGLLAILVIVTGVVWLGAGFL